MRCGLSTQVADFGWLGHEYLVRRGSRILRGRGRLFWLGDAENGIASGLGSVGEARPQLVAVVRQTAVVVCGRGRPPDF